MRFHSTRRVDHFNHPVLNIKLQDYCRILSQTSGFNPLSDISIDTSLPPRSALVEIIKRICIKTYGRRYFPRFPDIPVNQMRWPELLELFICQFWNIREINLTVRPCILFNLSYFFFYILHNMHYAPSNQLPVRISVEWFHS